MRAERHDGGPIVFSFGHEKINVHVARGAATT